MIHVAQVTVPFNTPETNPVAEIIKLTKGRLKTITVQFPPGCVNLVGVWFSYHGQKILPWNLEGVLFGDSSTLVFDFDYKIDSEPYEVIFCAYNIDDIFDHTIYTTLTLVPDTVERIASLDIGI